MICSDRYFLSNNRNDYTKIKGIFWNRYSNCLKETNMFKNLQTKIRFSMQQKNKYGNIFYILISIQFYNCLFCCENKWIFPLEQPIEIDSLMSSTLMSNG